MHKWNKYSKIDLTLCNLCGMIGVRCEARATRGPRGGRGQGLLSQTVPSADFSKETGENRGRCRAGVNAHPCAMTPKMAIRGHFSLGTVCFLRKITPRSQPDWAAPVPSHRWFYSGTHLQVERGLYRKIVDLYPLGAGKPCCFSCLLRAWGSIQKKCTFIPPLYAKMGIWREDFSV